ncbi:hypothetical protein AA0Z99_07730 [Agrococcus sp. 1P02AA]|uniref:hypothetical protein n=1 Tax=Agrococcus sp. 1P02AA TaxID=3132259 RepID=UPI0039A6A08E
MSDDELRRRLRDVPAPTARLDADAAIAAAKRRRRPKTVALSSAATIAGALIVAPLAVTGLQGLGAGGIASTSSDSGGQPESGAEEGVEESSEGSGAASQAPGPAAPGTESGTPGAPADAGEGDTGASESDGTGSPGSGPCAALTAGDAGLALRFLDDPADGAAELEVVDRSGAPVSVRVLATGSATIAPGGRTIDAGIRQGPTGSIQLPAGGAQVVAVELGPRSACPLSASVAPGPEPGADDAEALVAPLLTVEIARGGSGAAERVTLLGEPFDVR